MNNLKIKGKERRNIRVRNKIVSTKERPRLAVFRSNKKIYAQIIDDEKGKTLFFVSENELKIGKDEKATKSQKAKMAGQVLATKAIAGKITKVVFDRGSYKYHGRVKAFAQGAREGGLKF